MVLEKMICKSFLTGMAVTWSTEHDHLNKFNLSPHEHMKFGKYLPGVPQKAFNGVGG